MSDDNIHVPPPYYQQQAPTYQPPGPPQPPARGAWSGGAVVAAAVAGAVIGGILMAAAMLLLFGPLGLGAQQATPSTPSAPVSRGGTTIETTAQDQPVEAVAAKLTPSVVNVAVQENAGFNPFTGQPTQASGNGSGVIIRPDGYILTNNHVVSGATKITVTIGLDDLPAKVVGTDAASDIAVIKVDKTGLPAATLGNSDDLLVGESVVAIGSPFGLDRTVTSGIVSALHRSGQAGDSQSTQLSTYSNLIQTDAPINPGNSGGALSNLQAQVIGINTLIQTGGAQQSAGIGFAIPINIAKQVADQLISTGHATHTFLGVGAVDVNGANGQIPSVTASSGALVQQVVPGSPAAKAGIKVGDVIVKVGSQQVKSAVEMVSAVRSYKPGDKVPIVVERGGKEQTIVVTLGSSQ